MTQTETSKAKMLFVEVPMDAKDFRIWEDQKHTLYFDISEGWDGADSITLPQGNWTILNTLKDISNDEAEIIAQIDPEIEFEDTYTRRRYATYIDYMDDDSYYISPKNSIKSLAESLGLDSLKNYVILYELK